MSIQGFIQQNAFLHNHLIVYPKGIPVSPLTARVTISYPTFLIIYGMGAIRRVGVSLGWSITRQDMGWVGVSLGWSITPYRWWGKDPSRVGRCLCFVNYSTKGLKEGSPRRMGGVGVSLGWSIILPGVAGPPDRYAARRLSSAFINCN